jgi:HD-GYP domain-containing protein (c-di-GMP phosphodiesterase class II)
MFNQDTKKLECISSVNYRKSKDLFKLNPRPAPVEIKVFKTGRSVYKKNILCVPLVDEETCGVITVRDKIGLEKFSIFDQEIITTLAEQAVIAIRNAQLYKEQEDLTAGTIKSLGYLLDAKFPRLYTHTGLFTDLMLELGKDMGLTKRELKILHYSALLPDLGKLVMPTEVLQKNKALSKTERTMLKTHTVRGIEVLKYLDVLKPVIPIILHHHEKYNGTGYPDKLKGDNIPLGSRIMAVVDSFEAMICHRPYREPMPFRMAVSEIRRQAGRQFDPAIVNSFVSIAKDGRLECIVVKYTDELKRPL